MHQDQATVVEDWKENYQSIACQADEQYVLMIVQSVEQLRTVTSEHKCQAVRSTKIDRLQLFIRAHFIRVFEVYIS